MIIDVDIESIWDLLTCKLTVKHQMEPIKGTRNTEIQGDQTKKIDRQRERKRERHEGGQRWTD